jgi:glycosyltransferase involved in cell wall biosynthesis
MPRVSVLINTYNGLSTLRDALDSALEQTWRDLEVIVFDNGSSDGTPDALRGYTDPRVRYVRRDSTIPLGEARNAILSLAQGDYLAFLDADDSWRPQKLEKQIDLIERSGVGLVFTDAVRRYVEDNTEIGYFEYLGHQPSHIDAFADQLRCYTVVNSSALFRRNALIALGRWINPSFRVCTDFDLFIRIIHVYKADFVDEQLTIYNVAAGSTINTNQDILANELDQSMADLLMQWPEIVQKYPVELNLFRRMVDMQRAKSLWRQNKTTEARNYLWPHLDSPKHAAALAGTLLPYSWIMKLWNVLQKTRRQRARA